MKNGQSCAGGQDMSDVTIKDPDIYAVENPDPKTFITITTPGPDPVRELVILLAKIIDRAEFGTSEEIKEVRRLIAVLEG
jgi:hypothetical protein